MSTFVEEDNTEEIQDMQESVPEDVAAMLDLSKQKKKKKKKKTDEASATTTTAALDAALYSYSDMLTRAIDMLHSHNPEYNEKKRHTIKPPQLMRVGTTKTLWVNFQDICKSMKRAPDHVFQFIMSELGTEGSIDGNQRLVIRGKFVPKYIESLLRKYIMEYVTCAMCRSFTTTLTRDSVSRLYFVHCQDCGSSRSVAAIRAGYHAQTRADRRALRK